MTTNLPAIIAASYANPEHGRAIVALMDAYASDPMGGAQPLAETVRRKLVGSLAQIPGAITLLATVGGEYVGLMTAFQGFSTFKCKPLLNIHDVVVLPAHRGQGICDQLLQAMELEARGRGCCKLTLEVLSGNRGAMQAYRRFGFEGYQLDPSMGAAEFWEKQIL